MIKMRFGAALVAATLLGMFVIAPSAQVQAPPTTPPMPLAKAIVGLWRGDSIYVDSETNFRSTWIELRFTDYGVVRTSRGPTRRRPVIDSWTGDYVVVGSAVVISPHDPHNSIDVQVVLSSMTLVDDKLEALSANSFNDLSLGTGFSVRRQ